MGKVFTGTLPGGILPLGSNHLPFGLQLMLPIGLQMDDDEKIRIEVLKQIREQEFAGKQADLAAALGVQADYLSRVLTGKKGLSGDLARVWEAKLKKPKYYLDGVTISSQGLMMGAPAPAASSIEQIAFLSEQVGELVELFLRSSTDARAMLLNSARESVGSDVKAKTGRRRNQP